MRAESRHRRWWLTVFAALIVGSSLLLANIYGFKTDPLPDGSRFLIHGWPRGFLANSDHEWDPATGTFVEVSPWSLPQHDLELIILRYPENLLANGFAAIALLICTVVATMFGGQRPRFPFQLSLRQLIVVTTIFAAYTAATWRANATWDLWLTWKPLIFVPILYGILAAAVIADRGVSLAARSTRMLWAKWCGTMTN